MCRNATYALFGYSATELRAVCFSSQARRAGEAC